MNEPLRIVFLGTPHFAVASLRAIMENGFQVVAVVTAPDKPAGRGLSLKYSPVKQFAIESRIPVLQPTNLKDEKFLDELKSYKADLQVVIAFRMLPEKVWNMPRLGTVNLHASLLPDYRGAAPINWAIINGEKATGVSTFFLKHEIDTGNIISSETCEIGPEMNAGELHDLLMDKGAELIVKTLQMIKEGSDQSTPQSGGREKNAPKIFTDHCNINWEKKGAEIHNLIRGLSPYPGAFTQFGGKTLKVYASSFIPADMKYIAPGTVELIDRKILRFACTDGWVEVTDIQLEGKKRMNTKDFLIGYRPEA